MILSQSKKEIISTLNYKIDSIQYQLSRKSDSLNHCIKLNVEQLNQIQYYSTRLMEISKEFEHSQTKLNKFTTLNENLNTEIEKLHDQNKLLIDSLAQLKKTFGKSNNTWIHDFNNFIEAYEKSDGKFIYSRLDIDSLDADENSFLHLAELVSWQAFNKSAYDNLDTSTEFYKNLVLENCNFILPDGSEKFHFRLNANTDLNASGEIKMVSKIFNGISGLVSLSREGNKLILSYSSTYLVYPGGSSATYTFSISDNGIVNLIRCELAGGLVHFE
jgi:hypothetical protein